MKKNKYSWDLTYIFKNDSEFEKSFSILEKNWKEQVKLKGKINNKNNFIKLLELSEQESDIAEKVSMYFQKLSVDSTNEVMLKLSEKFGYLTHKYSVDLSWVSKQIADIGEKKVASFIKDSKFAYLDFSLKTFFRLQKYILPEEESKLLSKVSHSRSSMYEIYDSFITKDYKDPEIEYNGKKIVLTQNKYIEILEKSHPIKDAKLREQAVLKFTEKALLFKNTMFSIYKSSIEKLSEDVKVHGYTHPLQKRLIPNNIPEKVFHKVIEIGKKTSNLSKQYELLKIRNVKKHLKVKEINNAHTRLDVFKDDQKFTIDEGIEIVLNVAKTISNEYYENAKLALEVGKVDYLESEKKSKGAFCTGNTRIAPLILMNWTFDFDSVATLAHEVGHSVHTLFAQQNQKPTYQSTPIYVAEVASFTLELMVIDHLISIAKTKESKNNRFEKKLELFIGAFTRQLNFANFEYKTIDSIFKQIPLTTEMVSDIWVASEKEFGYGSIKKINESGKYSWAMIPHFYGSQFYVYQYATCFVAAVKFQKQIQSKNPNSFVSLLKAGSSSYPNDLFIKNNIDLTKDSAYKEFIKEFENLLNDFSSASK